MATGPAEELIEIANRLETASIIATDTAIREPLDTLEAVAKEVGKAWSGSWLGYQSTVYYADLKPPPMGARFSQEWGFKELYSIPTTTGDWEEFSFDAVRAAIYESAQSPNLKSATGASADAASVFDSQKSEVLSILTTQCALGNDPYLDNLRQEVEKLRLRSQREFEYSWRPAGETITRDMIALSQGYRTPPHITVLAEVASVRLPFALCKELSNIARKAGSHLSRKKRQRQRADLIGTNVFIGHGRSLVWRQLKDFVQDRLDLPWDEFNRVPVAGITNIARLSEMLDAAAVAFLIMTGDDEQVDGKLHARMNVVHEAGLFQGRLGFTKAIVLLEEGCEEFSNIQGLGQIRFPKGNLAAVFEDIRQVLEREGILTSAAQ
jgi:hypothetical protein